MARPRPLADYVAPCLGRALAAQGFAAADVIVSWPEIVGERLAAVSQPIRIDWPRGPPAQARFDVLSGPEDRSRRDGATIVVRIEGAFALELQHLAPIVIERINARYGWRSVARLALRQAPVRRRPAKAPAVATLSETDERRIGTALVGVPDEPLRAALDRLGRAVLSERHRSSKDA